VMEYTLPSDDDGPRSQTKLGEGKKKKKRRKIL